MNAHAKRGIVLMVLAMLTVPMVDGLAKHLSTSYSPLFLGWARYAVASLIVLPFAVVRHGRRPFPTERRVSHALRTAFLVTSMTLYFMAVSRLPLATATGASLVGPIVAVALSVPLLRERMTRVKVAALTLGVVGSLVMLRPGTSTDPAMLLAFSAGLFFAFYLIATRHASQASDPVQTLAFQCVVGTLLLTPLALSAWRGLVASDLVLFAALGGLSAVSHMLSITAFRFATASTLSPLVYVELVGAAIVGYVAFREVPDVPTMIGACFIVGAGLLLLSVRTRDGSRYSRSPSSSPRDGASSRSCPAPATD
jgi:drug/metabolite transporter (DMT)-like permease